MKRVVAAVLVTCALAVVGASAAPLKGDGPISITAGYGGVWVGFGDGSIRRIDPRTQRVGSPVRLGGFVHSLATGFASVWAATGTAVYRIDPRTMRASRVRGVPGWTPTSLAVGGDAVWVADISARSAVVRIDPRGARPQVTRVPGLMWLAAGPSGVWVQAHAVVRGRLTGPGGPRRVVKLDASSGRPTGVAIRVRCDQSLAVAADAVWAGDACDHALWTLDAKTGRPTGTRIRVPALGPRPVIGFGSVWVVGGGAVARVDPGERRLVRRIPARASVAAAGEGALWLLDYGDGTNGFVTRLDPATNRPPGRRIRVRP